MKQNRINELIIYLNKKKSVSVQELCERFGVSLNTARRDIAELCSSGVASKVYGGIILNEEKNVVPHKTRSVSNIDAKLKLAALASRYISSNETIYIDSGTTTVNILRYAAQMDNLNVLSSSLDVFNDAVSYEKLNVISTGGLLYPKTNSFIGMSVVATLNNYTIDKAFMAASAVTDDFCVKNNSFHEAEIKKAVTNRCHKIILMVDHTKFERSASIAFCSLASVYAVVTDEKPPEYFYSYFTENNIECVYPER